MIGFTERVFNLRNLTKFVIVKCRDCIETIRMNTQGTSRNNFAISARYRRDFAKGCVGCLRCISFSIDTRRQLSGLIIVIVTYIPARVSRLCDLVKGIILKQCDSAFSIRLLREVSRLIILEICNLVRRGVGMRASSLENLS